MTILTLDPLWRPNATGPAPLTREDRELVRQHSGYPATESAFTSITEQMNMVAEQSPATVLKIQGWIDEIEDLEEQQAAGVADGTAFLGNVEEYEGLRPGYNPTRQQLLKQADVLQWDVESVTKVRIKTGRAGGEGTATGMINTRIALLRQRILAALVLGDMGSYGGTMLERS